MAIIAMSTQQWIVQDLHGKITFGECDARQQIGAAEQCLLCCSLCHPRSCGPLSPSLARCSLTRCAVPLCYVHHPCPRACSLSHPSLTYPQPHSARALKRTHTECSSMVSNRRPLSPTHLLTHTRTRIRTRALSHSRARQYIHADSRAHEPTSTLAPSVLMGHVLFRIDSRVL
jgi:hypothetical protein